MLVCVLLCLFIFGAFVCKRVNEGDSVLIVSRTQLQFRPLRKSVRSIPNKRPAIAPKSVQDVEPFRR